MSSHYLSNVGRGGASVYPGHAGTQAAPGSSPTQASATIVAGGPHIVSRGPARTGVLRSDVWLMLTFHWTTRVTWSHLTSREVGNAVLPRGNERSWNSCEHPKWLVHGLTRQQSSILFVMTETSMLNQPQIISSYSQAVLGRKVPKQYIN